MLSGSLKSHKDAGKGGWKPELFCAQPSAGAEELPGVLKTTVALTCSFTPDIPIALFCPTNCYFQAPDVSINSFCVNSIYPGLFLHQVIWGGFVGAAHWRDSLQGRGLFGHHLGSGQQQPPPSCPFHLPRWLQNPHEANLVRAWTPPSTDLGLAPSTVGMWNPEQQVLRYSHTCPESSKF